MPDNLIAKRAVDMKLANPGMTARAIADALGVARSRVDAALKRWGVQREGARTRALRLAPGKLSAHRATNSDFSAALRGLDITLSEACRVLGRSMSTVCSYASGKPVPDSADRLLNLIVALGVERAEELIQEGATIRAGWRAAEYASGAYARIAPQLFSRTPVDNAKPID